MRVPIRHAVAALATCLFAGSAFAQSTNNARPPVETAPIVGASAPQESNLGGMQVHEFTGHRISLAAGTGAILYAPSQVDDPAFRAAISAAAGGVTVDYFDAAVDTPTAALLATYACVYTWADFAYSDNVLFGDRLAEYVDNGGTVVLGAFCTYTLGNALAGQIMTPGYCPVFAPDGANHFAFSPYVGDGVTCLYDGVTLLECQYRDILALQGAGIQDGSYADGEICHAYRPDGRVVYSNGNGGSGVTCFGDGAIAIANACGCLGGPPIDCACDGQFDIGDRVTLIVDNPDGNPDLFFGHQGTVICGANGFPPLLVLWDDFDGGHDGNGRCDCPSNGGGGSGGAIVLPGASGWYVNCSEVVLRTACPWDLDGSGEVDFGDLLKILSRWGPCPE